MIEWLQLTDGQKKSVLDEVSNTTGLPVSAIEKDWWVTLTLQACFLSPYKDNLVFKGGDIIKQGLAIDRTVF
jgi:hypothetical protein